MNILLLFSHPWRFGGAETYVTALAQGLCQRGHQVVLVTDQVDSTVDIPGVQHYSLTFRTRNPLRFIATYKALVEICRNHAIDMIHSQQRTAGYFGAFLAWRLAIGHVITFHDVWHRAPFKASQGKIFNHVIAVSEFMRQNFIKEFAADPSIVLTIHNGVDEGKFKNNEMLKSAADSLRRELAVNPAEILITFVGRVTRAKGCFDLVEATRKLHNAGVAFKCLVVGNGPNIGVLRDYIREQEMDRRIILAGYRDDIPVVMTASDIFVLPSHREALGLSVIEAMRAGKPVVAAAVGGVPEIIINGQTGLLVEPGNVDQLAVALRRLAEDAALRREMGERGCRVAREKFTVNKMVEATEEYYRLVLRCGGCSI